MKDVIGLLVAIASLIFTVDIGTVGLRKLHDIVKRETVIKVQKGLSKLPRF